MRSSSFSDARRFGDPVAAPLVIDDQAL